MRVAASTERVSCCNATEPTMLLWEFKTVEEIAASLQEAGLGDWSGRIASLSKPAVALDAFAIDSEDEIPIGASKLGGWPDVPEAFVWPRRPPYPMEGWTEQVIGEAAALREKLARREKVDGWHGDALRPWQAKIMERDRALAEQLESKARNRQSPAPLSFICQLNLEEVSSNACSIPHLPRRGRLLFFYDAIDGPWGDEPGDQGACSLIWDSSATSLLQRRMVPAELQTELGSYRALGLSSRPILSPLPWDSLEAERLGLGDLDRQLHIWRMGNAPTRHQLGGWADAIQHDVLGDLTKYVPYHEGTQIAAPADWHLILQIDSAFEENRMLWGDIGRLYVCMHEQDLRDRRFERARVLMQCY